MSEKPTANARAALFQDRNFRWLLTGSAMSMLGDQFTLIALPWLVLKMTGDTLMLGAVLAVISVPRALFILLGGALVDRHSPKRVLMITKYVNFVLLGLLALLVMLGTLKLWMVFVLASGIGLATAFSIPAGTSIMPHIVQREQLPAANSLFMGLRQLTMFAGPLLAGLLIAVFGDGVGNGGGAVGDARGLGFAFLFDALTFVLSAWTLRLVAARPAPAAPGTPEHRHVLGAVADGLRWCWNDRDLRICFLYWAAIMLFVIGPIQVAMPVLAAQLGHSAGAFGILVGMHGAGSLIGMIVSGIKPDLRAGSFGSTILLIDCIIGALFIPMGSINAIWQGALLLLTIGMLSGFLVVTIYTWLQRRVAPAMLGLTMSVFMFIMVGIAPISAAITGWLMRSMTPAVLFAGSGSMLIVIVLIALATTSMRSVAECRVESGAEH